MAATYEDFRQYLNKLMNTNDPRLQDSITVYDSTLGEYYPAEFVEFNGEDDILDDGHIFLLVST